LSTLDPEPFDAATLVQLGANIVEVSNKLAVARKLLASAQAQVASLELELRPLLTTHAALLSTALSPSDAITPPAPRLLMERPLDAAGPVPGQSVRQVASQEEGPGPKSRIKHFLRERVGDDPISAFDVAEALKVDASVVREVMREIQAGIPGRS
jgi:hypothetical protein